jgi:hypothetical protein
MLPPPLPLPVQSADKNSDGLIDYVEFCALMRNANEGLRKSAKPSLLSSTRV